jgi:hypothetical protein
MSLDLSKLSCLGCKTRFLFEAGKIIYLEGEGAPAYLTFDCWDCGLYSVYPLLSEQLAVLKSTSMLQIACDPKDPVIPMPSVHYYCDKRGIEVIPLASETRIRRWLDGSRDPSYAVRCRVCREVHVIVLVPVIEDYLLRHNVRIELHEGSVVRPQVLAQLDSFDLEKLANDWDGLSAEAKAAVISAEFEREFGNG